MYVLLSRVRARTRIILLRALSDSDYAYFVPPRELVAEQERLTGLCAATAQRLARGEL